MNKWTGRVVTDAGAIVLSEHLTAAVLTDEVRQYAMGLSVEYLYAAAHEN